MFNIKLNIVANYFILIVGNRQSIYIDRLLVEVDFVIVYKYISKTLSWPYL